MSMKQSLLIVIFVIGFIFVQNNFSQTFSVPPVKTSNNLEKRNIYKHSRLGFSFEYSSSLLIQEFPNSVSLINDWTKSDHRIDVGITRTYINSNVYEDRWAINTYNRLKKANLNETIPLNEVMKEDGYERHTYTKVENLKVRGYPAFKIIHEYEPRQNQLSLPNMGRDMGRGSPPMYVVSVYFKRGKYIWEVTSLANDKEEQEKTTSILETVLKTLQFSKSK